MVEVEGRRGPVLVLHALALLQRVRAAGSLLMRRLVDVHFVCRQSGQLRMRGRSRARGRYGAGRSRLVCGKGRLTRARLLIVFCRLTRHDLVLLRLQRAVLRARLPDHTDLSQPRIDGRVMLELLLSCLQLRGVVL